MITSFSITGLFGDRDILIPFESPIKILVAENGTGKTTLLNAIYSTLACDFSKLRGLDFQKIQVSFTGNNSVEITKEQIDSLQNPLPNENFYQDVITRFGLADVRDLGEMATRRPLSALMRQSLFVSIRRRYPMPTNDLISLLRHLPERLSQGELPGATMQGSRDAISRYVKHQLLYFPTYRRIEEELERLGIGDIELPTNDQLIQFGMTDVRASFEKITSEIKNSSLEWFSRINGQMLSQLIDGINVTDEMRQKIRDPEALKIVLDRSGENITQHNKDHILDLVTNNKLVVDDRFDPLTYFLANLIKVYDQQRESDNAIKEFTNVCNKYLWDKEVVYNESKVSIQVIRKKNSEPISISKLSSGEKQIISLFSKIYLDTAKTFAVFFDEPELSLSIEWQKQLLPHIVECKRCQFLLATTHSPFIFENRLDCNTSDLTEYIK